MSRRSAREHPLPKSEVDLLRSLRRPELLTRSYQLFQKGWTLQAIGDAFDPPKRRSTVKAWVDQKYTGAKLNIIVPDPHYKTPKGGYQRLTPVSPGVPADVAERLQQIAPQARLFRHRMPSGHPYAQANDEMNRIVSELRDADVSIADIARAANVTHRAIARRVQALR